VYHRPLSNSRRDAQTSLVSGARLDFPKRTTTASADFRSVPTSPTIPRAGIFRLLVAKNDLRSDRVRPLLWSPWWLRH
jgi:hypothetical protein